MGDRERVVGWLDALLADRTSARIHRFSRRLRAVAAPMCPFGAFQGMYPVGAPRSGISPGSRHGATHDDRWIQADSEHLHTAAGTAMLCPRFPAAHDHNLLVLARTIDAAGAMAEADAVLGAAGLTHRLLDATHADADADALGPLMVESGYTRVDELVMVHSGPVAAATDAATIVGLGAGERARTAAASWQAEFLGWDEGVCRQLGARIATLPADLDARFLAIRDPAGSVLARAGLYLRHGVAQVEELITAPVARRRGFGSALVREAVRRAREAGAELTFLLVDADDGPAALYRHLGFTDRGRRTSFTRP